MLSDYADIASTIASCLFTNSSSKKKITGLLEGVLDLLVEKDPVYSVAVMTGLTFIQKLIQVVHACGTSC